MDFRLGDQAEQLRQDLTSFLDDLLTEEVEAEIYRSGVSHHPDYVSGMIENGWFAGNWPKELGGGGLDPTSQMVVQEELGRREAPMNASSVSTMVAKALRAGVVWANTFNKFDPASPFGGYKESGFGREGGVAGLASYLRTDWSL